MAWRLCPSRSSASGRSQARVEGLGARIKR
jgi:hypothetical protein